MKNSGTQLFSYQRLVWLIVNPCSMWLTHDLQDICHEFFAVAFTVVYYFQITCHQSKCHWLILSKNLLSTSNSSCCYRNCSNALILCLRHHWKIVPEAYCIWVCPSVSVWVCVSQKPCEHHISKTNEGNFTQFWSPMYMGSQMCWIDFGTKRWKIKVTAGSDPKMLNTVSHKPVKGISPNYGHRCICIRICAG